MKVDWIGMVLVKLSRGTLCVTDAHTSWETFLTVMTLQSPYFVGDSKADCTPGVIHEVTLFLYYDTYSSTLSADIIALCGVDIHVSSIILATRTQSCDISAIFWRHMMLS